MSVIVMFSRTGSGFLLRAIDKKLNCFEIEINSHRNLIPCFKKNASEQMHTK